VRVFCNLALSGRAGGGASHGEGIGGGLYVTTGAQVTIKKSTVARNVASNRNNDVFGTVTYD
jgi:hypothetical protein